MHLAYLSNGYSPHDRNFLKALAPEFERISFLPLELDGEQAKQIAAELPQAVQLATLEPLAEEYRSAFWKLAAIEAALRKLQPDVILAGPLHSGAYACALAGSAPLVSMSWGFDILMDAPRSRALDECLRYALNHSTAIFCDATAVREQIHRRLTREVEILQFPWGVDLTRFPFRHPDSSGLRQQLGWRENIVVFSNRSWAPGYDAHIAVQAFALAYKQQPRLRMVLAGDGPLREEVLGAVRATGLSDCIHLPGRVSQQRTIELLSMADLYLSCAQSDGSSVSLLEAMASGPLPIVTDAISNHEWIDRAHGWFAPAGDAAAFAECIVEAATLDSAAQSDIAARNRAVIEDRANWAKNVPRLADLLRRSAR